MLVNLVNHPQSMSGSLLYRRATDADFPAILDLQRQNLRWNLSEADQQQGFLSVEYGERDLAAINADLGIYVAVEGAQLHAYAVAQTADAAQSVPLLAQMMSRFPDVKFVTEPVADLSYFIYGPVCITRTQRGRGILGGLLRAMSKQLASRFDLGIAFIAQSNLHSYQAHVRKNNLAVIDEFEFNEQRFWTVAFSLTH